MAGREKGYDKTPLIIRFIGMINSTDVSGLNGDRYIPVSYTHLYIYIRDK